MMGMRMVGPPRLGPAAEGTSLGLNNLWRYLAYTRPYWRWVVVGAVAGLVRMLVMLYLPHLLKTIIDGVISPAGLAPGARLALLWENVRWFVLLLPFHAAATLGRFYGMQIAAAHAIRDIRFVLFERLQRLSLAFHFRRPTGSIVSRMMTDVATAQGAFDVIFIQLLQNVQIAATALVYLLLRDAQWTGLSLVAVLPYFIVTRLLRRPLRQASLDTLESASQISGFVFERLSMVREVQAFTAEDHEQEQMRSVTEELKRYTLRQQLYSSILQGAAEIFRYSGLVLCLIIGSYRYLAGEATVGDITAFYLYLGMLLGPLEWLSTVQANIHVSAAAADRVTEFLDAQPDIADAEGARRLAPRRPPEVRFEDVGFWYPTDDPTRVLDGVTLTARPGARVVLVGESGAGKSTLMNVLPRFYDVQRGRILIDGCDISTATVRSLRRAIGIVPQEAVLFTGTVWENILYGRRDAPEEQVRAAAEAANADQFIRELPNGYETIVGERGVGLSGGQIQRIAIARAFLKDPAVLILDEATSNLDATSEALVLQAIERLSAGRTTFIIAHRLSVARSADLIVVLGSGRVLESGTHAELLARPGPYRELWERQVGEK